MKNKNSIIQVARLAGVSKSTVSRVVSDKGGSVSPKALAAVNAAIKELGYTRNNFAAALRSSKTNMILLMVPDIANPFWSEVARAVQDHFEGANYSVVVGNTDWSSEREAAYFELASSGRFDGLIVNSVSDDIYGLRALGVPVVMIGERSEGLEIDTVGTATYAAATLALKYLHDMGHRRIAIATSEGGSERYLSRRYRAYEDFHRGMGLPLDPELVFSVHLSEGGGPDLVERLLALGNWRRRVTALFCGNDILAVAALNAFRAAGVEPGRDISIMGMDDIPASSLTYPALTTISKPRSAIGAAAADLLLKRIAEPEGAPEKHLFPGELVIRDSVVEYKEVLHDLTE